MNDINFDCPECNRMIVVDLNGLGLEFACPHCAKMVPVPWEKIAPDTIQSPALVPPSTFQVGVMVVRCPCKHCKCPIEFDVKRCGEKIECPHCHVQTLLPKEGELKPIGDEKTWENKSGMITHVKCPTCRRMVLVTHEHREGREFVRFVDHMTKTGLSCYASFTCYRLAEE